MRSKDAVVVALCTLSVCGAWAFLISGRAASGQWLGVDEAVVGRFVEQAGRRSAPVFDWIRGDALLFAFLLAGLAAGFVIGFLARMAFGPEQRLQ